MVRFCQHQAQLNRRRSGKGVLNDVLAQAPFCHQDAAVGVSCAVSTMNFYGGALGNVEVRSATVKPYTPKQLYSVGSWRDLQGSRFEAETRLQAVQIDDSCGAGPELGGVRAMPQAVNLDNQAS